MLEVNGALQYRGKAVVVETKKADTHIIKIVPIELSGDFEGEWDPDEETRHHKHVDRFGNVEIFSCDYGQCMYAKWYKSGNRATSPDVTLGETVHLWEFEDTRVYFWTEDPRTDHYRCLEHIEFYLSNVRSEEMDEEHSSYRHLENGYRIQLSTRDKRIAIDTNTFDGEDYAHTMEILTGESIMRYTDNAGMTIEADSQLDKITLINHAGTTVVLDKTKIIAYAGKSISMKTTDTVIDSGSSVKVITNKVTLDTPLIETTAKTINAVDATLNVKLVNTTGLGALAAGAGVSSSAGSVAVSADLDAQNLKAKNVDVDKLEATTVKATNVHASHEHLKPM